MTMNGRKPLTWTFKTLKFGADGTSAEFHTMPFQFPVMASAAGAAMAYMIAEGERGNMVVVSLEPCEELKPVMDRVAEHRIMLDELKRQYTEGGLVSIGEMIRHIDPDWPDPWAPDPALAGCTCPGIAVATDCPIHGDGEES